MAVNTNIPTIDTIQAVKRAIDSTNDAFRVEPVPGGDPFPVVPGAFASVAFVRNAYASVNVTSAAYVQLVASTAAAYQQVQIFDSSGQTLKLAFGGAGVEVDKLIIPPGGTNPISITIPSGTRVSIKAISATASVGEIDIQFLGV